MKAKAAQKGPLCKHIVILSEKIENYYNFFFSSSLAGGGIKKSGKK